MPTTESKLLDQQANPRCDCDDLSDLQRAHGDHYDDCPNSLYVTNEQIAELEELARKRPNQAQVWRVLALCATVKHLRAENERLASQLKEWQEDKDTKAGYL